MSEIDQWTTNSSHLQLQTMLFNYLFFPYAIFRIDVIDLLNTSHAHAHQGWCYQSKTNQTPHCCRPPPYFVKPS